MTDNSNCHNYNVTTRATSRLQVTTPIDYTQLQIQLHSTTDSTTRTDIVMSSNIPTSFRLPQEVLDYIDRSIGSSRSDKLIRLLGFSSTTDSTTDSTTTELETRLNDIEQRLKALEHSPKDKPPTPKTIPDNLPDAPHLEKVNGAVSHKDYRNEIDGYVLQLTQEGISLAQVADVLNNLGWITSTKGKWTRNAVGAITRRLKG